MDVKGLDTAPRVSVTNVDGEGDVLTIHNDHQMDVYVEGERAGIDRRKRKTATAISYLDEIIADADEGSDPDDKDYCNRANPRTSVSASPASGHSNARRRSRR